LSGCASILSGIIPAAKWDDDTPNDQLVTLVYCEDIKIGRVDGVEKRSGQLWIIFQGKGTAGNPRKILQIPAGRRTLSVSYNYSGWSDYKETTYNFQPKRTYQMNVTVIEPDAVIGADDRAAVITRGDVTLAFEFIDITK